MKQTVRQINFLFLFLVIVLWTSCKPEPIDPHVVISINDEFKIDLWETLAIDVSSLSIHVKTLDSVYCENSSIQVNNDRLSTHTIRLTINGVDTSEVCPEENAPAKSIVNIGYLQNGTFKFDINLKGTTIPNEGTLIVSDDSYQLNMETKNGLKIIHPTLYKVPSQTIWGVINFKNTPQAVNAGIDFLREVKTISTEKEYTEGYYGHFTITENNEIVTDYDNNLDDATSFILDYADDVDNIQAIINQYEEEFGDIIDIQVYTWDGRVL